tara:strand:+ start:2617 stop:3150 length:534 start_codon:yes stop_codon:yes gene_type:complete
MAKAQYIDNVILDKDLFRLYKDLLDSPTWCLSRSSIPNETYGNFPGKVIKDNNQIFDPVWNAYFSCLSERINQKFFEKYGYDLPSNIRRIHLGAKNKNHITYFHSDNLKDNTISIVGFLTPVWEKVWGGELYVEEEKIDFVPGRFVIFQSERIHNGAAPTKDLHWWRISVNYTLSYD